MTDNLRIWNALSKTDPKHTKPFSRAGGFKGTATKPIWLTMRLTEQFGPAGSGWGMGEPKFETVSANDEILVFCTVSLWYLDGEKAATVYGVGGDKVLGKNKYGPFTNDEAFKASYTDALSNAMKQIGVAADIHMGLFDDDKYVSAMEREFANSNKPDGDQPHQPGAAGSAAGGGDFRPAGPRTFRPNNGAEARAEAQRDGLVDPNKKKPLPGAPAQRGQSKPITLEERAKKIKDATDKRVGILKNTKNWTRPVLNQFYADNKEWADWMADPNNGALDEYERFTKAYSAAELTIKEVA